ncbi:putative regulator of chromosome condensation 1/beta-lactamase-inhibitor protein II [Lupinus albus]|uniref:Putative regulator of chromosome condensation 1/beta-lactamase-inhibitor protein II n=1 Tax=Lupinus albus TaxID=3870 RepID=A0A6A4P9R5_LUPAL|nr:putative regulator of chromosome condensation 1/beta-lactamase-inhibitor protein II [Lupinus albus]
MTFEKVLKNSWPQTAIASNGQQYATWRYHHVGILRGTLLPLKMIRLISPFIRSLSSSLQNQNLRPKFRTLLHSDSDFDFFMAMSSDGNEPFKKKRLAYMWGYLPGALPQRTPLLTPVLVRVPPPPTYSWVDVSGGGCGFAMAISESGKLITWGSTDDLGQSYVTSGKHGETPEPFPLPTDASIVKAAAGWAHCVAVTDCGEVYTWGWKECVPSGKVIAEPSAVVSVEKDVPGRQSLFLKEQGTVTSTSGEENTKRRRISSAKQAAETSSSGDDVLTALPCLVTLNPGVRISSVAAGGRHTLALSDIGQVWGWGYGGEGQLGLGSRVRMVPSPHLLPCIDSSSYVKDSSVSLVQGSMNSDGHNLRVPGSYVKGIACGGRHSAVITDAGAVLAFGWGLYGQCGQGSTDDELRPTCVSSLLGIRIEGVAAGLWHTVCTSADGDVYAFGGNQFGQLGTGVDQAETLPKLLDCPSLENVNIKSVSCGARHTAAVTDDGKVFCWGWNKYGQLGLGDVIDRNIPSEVTIEGCAAKNVACGWWHTLLLAESPT